MLIAGDLQCALHSIATVLHGRSSRCPY
jgi:hypothetical protein